MIKFKFLRKLIYYLKVLFKGKNMTYDFENVKVKQIEDKINLIETSKYKIIDMSLFFKINKSGKIIDAKVKSNIDEAKLHNNVKNEISRVLNSVPNLNPAIYRGKRTIAYYNLPVKINLN